MGDFTLRLYHEKQVAGLCAVHCINTLLQGRYLNEIDLMQIAQSLDEQEREAMRERGNDNPEFLKFLAAESGNVADDGNYSHPVILKALEMWNIDLKPATAPEVVHVFDNLPGEDGYVLNLQNHWFTLRKIDGLWWNFDSLLSSPQHVSDKFLSTMIQTFTAQGYTIFVARGNFPIPTSKHGENWVMVPNPRSPLSPSNWNIGSFLSSFTNNTQEQPAQQHQQSQQQQYQDEDEDLALAIALSLKE
mmetsp:Transcript_29387/g.45424  ORF Transcript_29387/g.45424 Transcript_29387/m.45424 type:complete len:246 (+) Transcript_29387:147-884(+)